MLIGSYSRYTWTSVFVALYYVAVNFTQYWGLPQLWHNVIFGVAPVAIFAINMLGVNVCLSVAA
jgi:hypothetical protein